MDREIPHQYTLVRVRKERTKSIDWSGLVSALIMAAFGAVLYTCAMMENMPGKGPGAF